MLLPVAESWPRVGSWMVQKKLLGKFSEESRIMCGKSNFGKPGQVLNITATVKAHDSDEMLTCKSKGFLVINKG